MNYTVIWPPPADDQLTDQYLVALADGRGDEFTQSVSEIEVKLARDPLAVGESRDEPDRVLIELPALVTYDVDSAARTVNILGVRYVP
jgi:hypothetical protein